MRFEWRPTLAHWQTDIFLGPWPQAGGGTLKFCTGGPLTPIFYGFIFFLEDPALAFKPCPIDTFWSFLLLPLPWREWERTSLVLSHARPSTPVPSFKPLSQAQPRADTRVIRGFQRFHKILKQVGTLSGLGPFLENMFGGPELPRVTSDPFWTEKNWTQDPGTCSTHLSELVHPLVKILSHKMPGPTRRIRQNRNKRKKTCKS